MQRCLLRFTRIFIIIFINPDEGFLKKYHCHSINYLIDVSGQLVEFTHHVQGVPEKSDFFNRYITEQSHIYKVNWAQLGRLRLTCTTCHS